MGFSLRTLRVLALLGLGSSALAFALCEAAATTGALVSTGALWRYHDGGADLGTSWRDPGFDDSGWAEGPAELGFGDGDEATVVDGGPSGDRHITTYFRHGFSVDDPESIEGLTLALRRDDGAVVYLNGAEILRSNLPSGPIQASTLARNRVGGGDEDTFLQAPVSPCLLVAGQNVLAVEVHQESDSSADLSFDLSLETAPLSLPVLVRPPYLQLATPTGLVVRWRTDVATEGMVRLGPSPDSLSTAVSGGCTTEHQIGIDGLTPAPRQYYAVAGDAQTLAGGDSDHWFEVPPVPGPDGSVRILAMGDSGDCAVSVGGCENAAAVQDAYLAVAAGDPADVLLLLGDNAYVQGTDAEYTAGLFQPFARVLRNSIVWPAPGNHEFGASDSPTQSGPYYDAFTLPTRGEAGGVASGTEAYYSFDRGDVHFVSIDSHDTDRSVAGPMYAWLEADLAATQREWVIVYWHHPPLHGQLPRLGRSLRFQRDARRDARALRPAPRSPRRGSPARGSQPFVRAIDPPRRPLRILEHLRSRAPRRGRGRRRPGRGWTVSEASGSGPPRRDRLRGGGKLVEER